jgi:peptide/nickel transport system substrate-binding protein/oligopeptide transport system substrate-binding protein
MIFRHRHPAARSLAALVLLLCLAGCRPSGDKLPGHLYLRLSANPTTLDPALVTDVTGGLLAAKIFNGLVRFNDNLDIVPDIAESWQLSHDHRTYTFRLKKGHTFSNGRAVTASDFQYSFERILDPRTRAPITWVLDRIVGAKAVMAGTAIHASGIRVIDDHTLAISLERPFGPFLSLLGMTTAYVVPREEIAKLGVEFGNHPVGSGPYILNSWKHGQSLVLSARDDYPEGSPRLNGIVYRVIPEDLTAVMEFETGGLDALQVPASEYRRYTMDRKWESRIFKRPGLNCYYLGLNCSRPPFDNASVRRAMNMAIDRKRILETVYENRGLLAAGPVPPTLWKYGAQHTLTEGYRYDPKEAKRLISAAGLEGKRIRIYISTDAEILDILEVIQQYLSRTGLRAEIVQLDWSAFKQALNKGEADAFWLSWWADYPDPENFLYPMFHSANAGPAGNRAWYEDRLFDRLIEQAQSAADEQARYALYRQADEQVVRNAPWVFMWHRSDTYVVQDRVRDFRIYPIYSVDKGMDISLK